VTALTRWVLAHKLLVVAFWAVLTVVGMATVSHSSKAMNQKFTVPGKQGFETNQTIIHRFGLTGGNTGTILPTVTLPPGTTVSSPGIREQLANIDRISEKAVPGARIASYATTGSRAFVSSDGRTVFSVVYPRLDPNAPFGGNPDASKHLDTAMQGVRVAGQPVYVTGYDALQNQEGGNNGGPGVFLEALLGGLGALIILAVVFGSLLAFVPILMAIVAIMTSFLVVWGITTVAGVSPIVEFLIALIGLGVAIDYALLVVVRWREETAHGAHDDEAIVRAMATAGRSVVFSGTTVAIGLLALIALPLPFLRSVGYGGMVIPLVSTLVAITLLPIVLATWGERLNWPHHRTDDKASRGWTNWAKGIVHRRWIATIGALAVLGVLVVAAGHMELGAGNPDTLAKSGDARTGLQMLEKSGIGNGVIAPYELTVAGANPDDVASSIASVQGIHGAVAPAGPQWRRGGLAIVNAFGTANPAHSAATDTLSRVQDAADDAPGVVHVGGLIAEDQDFIDAVYGNFPLMILLIGLITFVLLARAFRSILLPLKAIVLNVISVAAAWGVLTIVWQEGHGSNALWGIPATGSLPSWIPIVVFAFLFGLSMDYEVFILARMRESYDETGDTNTAVVTGIGRTGRLVTSAALILFLAFASLGAGPQVNVKQLATGLAAGILIDATIIRALLVPAIVSLLGKWNWWLPARPARWLRVAPSGGDA
jgi:putative drug exporter of the RND superfamily